MDALRSAAFGNLTSECGKTGGPCLESLCDVSGVVSLRSLPCSLLLQSTGFGLRGELLCVVQLGGHVGRHSVEGISPWSGSATKSRVAAK
jgi:hypothetical protein